MSFAQRLSLVGSNFSFAKGNIDVEVLTEIIQQKQDEVLERVFRNLVVENFQKATGAEKSFATYSYIYDILHALTIEKNKTVITRQVINKIFEYCLVYGFTREFIRTKLNGQSVGLVPNTKAVNGGPALLQHLESIPVSKDNKVFLKDIDDDEWWKQFNVLLDMAYDIFLNDETNTSLHTKGLFKLLKEKPTLQKWYEQDNAYLDVSAEPTVRAIRKDMEKAYNDFKTRSFGGTDLINVYKELQETEFKQETITETQYNAVKKLLRLAITSLKTYSDNNIIGNISDFLLDYTLVEFAPENTEGGTGSQPNQQPSKRGILYIDAEGLISNLYEKFASNDRRSTIAREKFYLIPRPFLVIGATHSGAFNSNNQLLVKDNTVSNLNSIYFANEKIGLKFTFIDRKYTHSFEPGEEFKYHGRKIYWVKPQKEPIISRYELYLYGSGLLYNIVDIKSQENFNYTLVGGAFGITFFNGLMLNTGVALPINAKSDLSKKYLYTLSFDIPIIEYINAVRKKRSGS
jgi:hypothetical protein